jgi:hypothetical protein
MRVITKTAAVENATAIWEYDPSLEDNRVLGGALDVVVAIRTLGVKVRHSSCHSSCCHLTCQINASGQWIACFERIQRDCGMERELKLILHSNIRWGTARQMLHRFTLLCEVC